jgi:phospholipid/cholesterol/gamma-HCH transport system permease protein
MAPERDQRGAVRSLGARMLGGVRYAGGMTVLVGGVLGWLGRAAVRRSVRFGRGALSAQMVRVGVRSFGIVALVQLFIGVILALQMTPPLRDPWQQEQQVAVIIGFASFRMLGPIITAVVLSGFAGASIAAELGTMVVAEEIEAMEAMALNPIRYLVVPRVVATTLMMVLLTVLADWMICLGGWLTSRLVLGPRSFLGYWDRIQAQLTMTDLVTGLIMAAVFGLLISTIACHEGLRVRGGAEGVGRATTMTVVYSIVSIVVAACVFTVIFFVFGI